MIKNNIFIHPNSKISTSTIIEPFSYIDSNVEIGKNCWIGMNCIILKNVIIGDNTVIGAGSVVISNCDPNSVYAGNPAIKIKDI